MRGVSCLLAIALAFAGCGKSSVDSPRLTDPLLGTGAAEKVADGFEFTEGPLWIERPGYLLFTDTQASAIEKLVPPSAVSVLRRPSNASNGLAVDPGGLLIACEGGAHRVTRTLADGTVESIAARYGTRALNSPNDVIVARNGTIYFTDPDFGAVDPNDKQPVSGVYRLALDRTLTLIASDLRSPNGIALSPDDKTLYVGEMLDHYIRQYVVHADGTVDTPKKLADTARTPDGIGIDDLGNLYVSTLAGVQVFSPEGALRGTIAVPEQPSNCTFGGEDRRTLYITARTSLYQVRVNVPGKP